MRLHTHTHHYAPVCSIVYALLCIMLLYTHLFDSVISRAVKECRKEVQASQIYVLVFGPASTTPLRSAQGRAHSCSCCCCCCCCCCYRLTHSSEYLWIVLQVWLPIGVGAGWRSYIITMNNSLALRIVWFSSLSSKTWFRRPGWMSLYSIRIYL